MRTVVITGAGSGIGAATTIRLDEDGWRVFACVHNAEDGAVIDRQTSNRVTVLPLDVTNADSIKDAAAAVELALGGEGLHALIDNAGVAVAGPPETLPIDNLRDQLEVNVVGQVATTQQFLPMLRRTAGSRVVFVGSIGGKIATGFAGPYHASKFAMEAIADAWRQELLPDGPSSQEGVDLILHAVSAERPHTRYANGLTATVLPKVRRMIPDRLFDRLALRVTTKADA